MSTPMNPNQPQGGAHYPPQQQPATAGGPGAQVPQQAQQGGFVPGQQGAGIDTGAPSQARLPQRLGDDANRTKGIPFGRLFSVELRKIVDTRAGKWLMFAIAGLILLATGVVMFSSGTKQQPMFENFVAAAGIPLGFLLPILGILTVTSEWSQRTGLVTFTLEPRRSRIGFAKWGSALLLGALSIVFALVVGALFTLVAQLIHGHDANWSISGWLLAGTALAQLLGVSQGIAFGLLIQNTPGAICAYLFIPILVSLLASIEQIKDIGKWVDPNQSSTPIMMGEANGEDWKHFVVSQILWLVIPMVLGFIRLNKREVKSS
ncbi:ABC transporter permease [Dermacoccus abyssi]|uniref:ABC transporter permease n=1 Tax=Dermacoccus abyssi TaxID=322596 RepID=A0ABX5Z603_9MICO|nr:ABC transporter permease [Dermacoccus abyssi]